LNQLTAVNRTLARLRLVDRGVHRTGPHGVEADRDELHATFAALARMVLDDVLVARHRADVRERRQTLILGGRSGRLRHCAAHRTKRSNQDDDFNPSTNIHNSASPSPPPPST